MHILCCDELFFEPEVNMVKNKNATPDTRGKVITYAYLNLPGQVLGPRSQDHSEADSIDHAHGRSWLPFYRPGS
jgi:hypothetical protein